MESDSEAFPRNILECMERFGTERACAEYLAAVRWPRGCACPRCAGAAAWTTARGTLFCKACRRQTSPMAGTVLHKSRVPWRGWFLAMRLACTQQTGPSAAGLQRELGPGSYRTAWLLLAAAARASLGDGEAGPRTPAGGGRGGRGV